MQSSSDRLCCVQSRPGAAILLGLDSSLTYKYRSVASMQLGQLEAALSDLDQAVAKQPDNL